MPEFSVPWGQGSLKVSVPADWRLQQMAQPDLPTAPGDWPDRLALALSQSQGETPLSRLLKDCRHGRIVLLVEDMTRHSPLAEILPVVLREITHAGLDVKQVEAFFANGMHPPLTAEQASEKLGPACEGIPWRCNRYDDLGAHVPLGQIDGVDILADRWVADADLRIVVSSVSPHLQAGFGGGYKMMFPGCSHLDTIRGLHRKGIGRKPRQLVGTPVTANPMRRIIDAAGVRLDERHGRTFAIQYLLDDNNRPTSVAAGDVLDTHRMMAKRCAVACGVVVAQPGDILITNAHPRDFDLWQCFKSIANTRWAARPNGAIICLARCQEGLHGMRVPSWWPASPEWMRRIVRWIGPESLSSLVTRLVPRLAGDAAFFVRMATQTVHRNPIFMVSPNLHDAGVVFPGVSIFARMDDAVAVAQKHLGEGPQRVVVFPSGGTTFPTPKSAGLGG